MLGVSASSFPKQEKSAHPISSIKTRIMLGRFSFAEQKLLSKSPNQNK
jgi:hypothetical protein